MPFGVLEHDVASNTHHFSQRAAKGMKIPVSDYLVAITSAYLIATLIVQIIAIVVFFARVYTKAFPWRFRIDDYLLSLAFVSSARYVSSLRLEYCALRGLHYLLRSSPIGLKSNCYAKHYTWIHKKPTYLCHTSNHEAHLEHDLLHTLRKGFQRLDL